MHSRPQLKEAIAQRDVEALEKAIAAAVEVRLQDPLVAQAQQLLSLLQAQQKAAAALAEAVAARDAAKIRAAIGAADKVGRHIFELGATAT